MFERPMRIEIAYEKAIYKLLDFFFRIPAFEVWNDVVTALQGYAQATQIMREYAERLASRMVTAVSVQNANSWREAARQSTKGASIYYMLRQELMQPRMRQRLHFLIQENAQYISTIPQEIASRTVHYVQQEQMAGRRAEDILHDLRPHMQNLKKWQVERIARTEVAKADTAITRTRAEDINLNWYEWTTSHDARVRQSHRKMAGVLVEWNDPPAPEALIGKKSEGHYHAGNIYNCRCLALPLVTPDEVKWPHKVYTGGRIVTMSLAAFNRLQGVPVAA